MPPRRIAYITLQGLNMKLIGNADSEKNLGERVLGYKVISQKDIMSLNPDTTLL